MDVVVLDENSVEIDKFNFVRGSENYNVGQIDNVPEVSEGSKKILNNLNYGIGIYSPVENSDDFYISFLNNSTLQYSFLKLDDVKGAFLSDVFLAFDKKRLVLQKMREVYNTDQSQTFFFEYYDNNILIRKLQTKIIKVDDFVYMLGEDKTDYFSLSQEQDNLFDNDVTGIAIIQDSRFVKCNKKYLELFEHENYDTVINKKIGYSGFVDDSIKKLYDGFNEVIDGNMFSYSLPLEINKDGKLFHYFNLNGNYTIYNGKPAVMVFYNDITEQELNKREIERKTKEALVLQNNMDFIQSVSNTGSAYVINGEFIRSSKLYEMLERDPYEEDSNTDILWDIVIDEDRHVLEENYRKLGPDHDFVDFIIRINTAKNNLIYIHCYIKVKYMENDRKDVVSFYQDVTDEQLYLKELQEALDESLVLKNNLEKIQRISKTGMSYTNDKGTLDWSKPSFDTLKLDQEKYENYHGGLVEIILPEDLHYWQDAYSSCSVDTPEVSTMVRVINGDGDLAYIKCYMVCDYDEEGNEINHVNFYQDITKQVEKENKLKKSLKETLRLRDNLNRIQNASRTAMSYSEGDGYSIWTPEVFNILEINPHEYVENTENLIERFVIDEDLIIRKNCINQLSPENTDVSFNQRIKTGKGNLRYIRTIIHREYDEKGKIINRVSFNQDITSEIKYQNQLESALNDKEMLLTEVHHRVKNNLQIILSLINLNKGYESDPETIINDTENRIYAMALIHEKIYGSDSLSEVNMKDYVESLVTSLFDTYWSNIRFHSEMEPINLDMEESIPLGLIINELVINAIKYAFPDGVEGNLYIDFKKVGKHYLLVVKDDGVGLPDNFDLGNLSTLGLVVVQNLTLQIGGTLSIMDCDGAGFKIEFDEE